MNKKYLVIGLFVLPVLVLLVQITRNRHVRPLEISPAEQLFAPLYKKWATQEFTPISADNDFRSKIETLVVDNRCGVNTTQVMLIRHAAYDMLNAFHSESYEKYLVFRTPVPAKPIMSRIDLMKKYGSDDWKNPSRQMPDRPEDVFRKFWEIIFLNKYVPDPNAIKGSTVGKPLWAGVALGGDNSGVVIDQLTDLTNNLSLYIGYQDRTGATVYPPSFIFSPTPESIINTKGKLVIATVKCLVEFAKPEVPCPVYARYYWDDQSQKWLPFELALAVPGLSRTRDMVF